MFNTFIPSLQKARMARIRIAKATSGAAFVSKKKAVEAKLAAQESGQDIDDGPEDIFELQHHHLLRCLEKTTVSSYLTSIRLPNNHTSQEGGYGEREKFTLCGPIADTGDVVDGERRSRIAKCGENCKNETKQGSFSGIVSNGDPERSMLVKRHTSS